MSRSNIIALVNVTSAFKSLQASNPVNSRVLALKTTAAKTTLQNKNLIGPMRTNKDAGSAARAARTL